MNLLPDVQRLLRLSEHRQQRCESMLQRTQKQLVPITTELSAMDAQEQSLREFLLSHKAENRTLSHADLMALLRRQAVLRRQLHNLTLDRVRVNEKRESVESQVHQQRLEYRGLQRKHSKYTDLQQRLVREHRLALVRREEAEIEELPRSPK
jgi:hypothetical protein